LELGLELELELGLELELELELGSQFLLRTRTNWNQDPSFLRTHYLKPNENQV
jgi:hypothetical protein